VRPQLAKEPIASVKLNFCTEDMLLRANALFGPDQAKDLESVIAEKIEDLRHYDVLAMDRVAAILMWGRSGSLLLCSYLDGHEDVIMLPELSGQRLYEFFERYQSLSLLDKLIGYATFEPDYPRFFNGDFAISPGQYYAAVQAILKVYAEWPSEFLQSRRAFFLFVHIAYNLALGRRPGSSHPLIVYAQHEWDNGVAGKLVEDFPQTKFVHTIRDPISSCEGVYNYHFGRVANKFPRTYVSAPYSALLCLTNVDRPHSGMESRTRTIRFEDLHGDIAGTMRDVSDWLGLPYQSTLLDSTFNGIPWVVTRDGKAWSGPRLEQVQRHPRNLSRKDRALLFALFYENFVNWDYPCPKIFRYLIFRCVVFVSLFLFPMKTEIIAARAVFERRILPAVRHGNISSAIRSLLGIGFCRLRIIWLLAPAFWRRCAHGTTLLQVDQKSRSTGAAR
jgi:Sulfotransferase family